MCVSVMYVCNAKKTCAFNLLSFEAMCDGWKESKMLIEFVY